jgi:hypothetical protein
VRRIRPLPLERDRVVSSRSPLDGVQPIDAASPLRGVDHTRCVEAAEAESSCSLSAVDDTSAQLVHARTSYRAHEVCDAQARVRPMFDRPRPDGDQRGT